MLQIIPAIMPKSLEDLREKAERVAGAAPIVQIDLMDGVFVPEKTWPYFDRAAIGLPAIGTLSYEIDLMVDEPEAAAIDWARAGAERVIVHIENAHRLPELIATCRKEFGESIDIGIAIGTDTPNEALAPFIPQIDFVQCMGIARIGYQRQPFDPRVIPKIHDLREQYPQLIISVDGGVNFETALPLIKAGATRLVSGSAIYDSADIAQAIDQLKHHDLSR